MSQRANLRFGLCTDQNMTWDETVERWQLFESLGFDSVWDCDHYQQPSRPQGPYFEGWTLLAALAARTSTIRVGVLVTSNTFRHPALLAKQAVTVDHISNGRLELGLGAGWFVPEHENFGIPFPEPAELVGRFREAVQLVDLLLRQDVTTFDGTYYQVKEAPFRPRPLQKPRPPLTLGAHRSKMLRVVAEYADRWNSHGTVDELRQRNSILDDHCSAIGRDPHEIIRSLYGWAALMPADPWESIDAFHEVVGRYGEAGINEFIIDAPGPDRFDMLARIATEVIPGLRAGSPAV
ncbi:MAG: TIGR03560 family F420-dependent LLM class oxidoreductase [Thermomicrobiales bacterium]|nr:TIGR03560 family F420-dependent LLM class oxidoreductase [Thermomicrobiales bacterium]